MHFSISMIACLYCTLQRIITLIIAWNVGMWWQLIINEISYYSSSVNIHTGGIIYSRRISNSTFARFSKWPFRGPVYVTKTQLKRSVCSEVKVFVLHFHLGRTENCLQVFHTMESKHHIRLKTHAAAGLNAQWRILIPWRLHIEDSAKVLVEMTLRGGVRHFVVRSWVIRKPADEPNFRYRASVGWFVFMVINTKSTICVRKFPSETVKILN